MDVVEGCIPQLGAVNGGLVHDGRVAELLDEAVNPLDRRVRTLEDPLRAVALLPLCIMHGLDEGRDEVGVDEVDEAVADVHVALEIDAQVREVVLVWDDAVKAFFELGPVPPVWDVAKHHGGTHIVALQDGVDVDRLWLCAGVALVGSSTAVDVVHWCTVECIVAPRRSTRSAGAVLARVRVVGTLGAVMR